MTVLELCGGGEISVAVVLRGREVLAHVLSDHEQQRLVNICPRRPVRREDPEMVRDAAERDWRSDCAALFCAASLRLNWTGGAPYSPAMETGALETWASGVLRIDCLRARLSGAEIDGVNAAWQGAAVVRRREAAEEAKKD